MLEIRVIRPDEALELARLRSAAFAFPTDPENPRPVLYECLGAYEDGKLCASLAIRPYEGNWCGTYLPILGVGGVMTLPLARRSGLIRRLFAELDRLAAERGWAYGLLYPFSYSYYRQFGYERVAPRVELTIPFEKLDCAPRNADAVLYDGSQSDALLALYHRYADAHNLMTRRPTASAYAAEPERNLRYTYLHRAGSDFDAYVTVQYDRDSDAVTVQELVYTTPESLYGILGVLRLFEGQRRAVRFASLPVTSPVIRVAGHYTHTARGWGNGAMGRVLDTQTLLEHNRYPDAPGCFTLTVHDTLPSCAGTFAVEYAAGHAEVRRTELPADIETDAPNLSRILLSGLGYGAQEIAFLPNTAVHTAARAEDFARAFPRRMTDLLDHF
ncbi:MAG: GNAT family N-acetyltransferase [Clostridiaceae bacterium]|nr:GNAT family N-acetyltransferase [Clostridiaceae bacterium]